MQHINKFHVRYNLHYKDRIVRSIFETLNTLLLLTRGSSDIVHLDVIFH